jgi:hypothetical protein
VKIQPQWVVTPGKQTKQTTNKVSSLLAYFKGSLCLHLQGHTILKDEDTMVYETSGHVLQMYMAEHPKNLESSEKNLCKNLK